MTNPDSEMFADISVIISMMPNQMRNRINIKLINFIENNKEKDYVSYIDPTIPLKEQELKEETQEMLGIIYRDYLCTKEQREKLIEQEKETLKKYEVKLGEKYISDNLFKNRIETANNKNNSSNILPVEIKKERFIIKIISFIKNIFKK